MPVRMTVMGISRAATTPPAANSDHQISSFDLAILLGSRCRTHTVVQLSGISHESAKARKRERDGKDQRRSVTPGLFHSVRFVLSPFRAFAQDCFRELN